MSNVFLSVLEVSLIGTIFINIMLMVNRYARNRYSLEWMQFLWIILAVRLLLPADMICITVPQKADTKRANTIRTVANVIEQQTTDNEQRQAFSQQKKTIKRKPGIRVCKNPLCNGSIRKMQ